jgi:hypothetical protein
MTRYQACQDQVAGRTTGEIFREAAAFLELTAAYVRSVTPAGADVRD